MRKPYLEKRHFRALLRVRSQLGPGWRARIIECVQTDEWPAAIEPDIYMICDTYAEIGQEGIEKLKFYDLLIWANEGE